MKFNLLFIVSVLLLSGCQTTNPTDQQQQEACKTLAYGYLKIQTAQDYQLWRLNQIETQTPHQTLKLIYKQPTENGVIMSSSLQPKIEFLCTLRPQQIELALLPASGQPIQVLALQLAQELTDKPENRAATAQQETQ